jgi:hypothetical protein
MIDSDRTKPGRDVTYHGSQFCVSEANDSIESKFGWNFQICKISAFCMNQRWLTPADIILACDFIEK